MGDSWAADVKSRSWIESTRIPRLFLAALVILLSRPPSAQAGKRMYRDGVMIDSAEYDWCHYDCAPSDRPTFFFCIQVDGAVLIGSHKADFVWQYDSSQMLGRDKPVSLRYDDRAIWIIRTDGKEMHLTRDYSEDMFSRPECTAEVHRPWLWDFEGIKRPDSVPPEAVLVPQGPRPPIPLFFRTGPLLWVDCRFDWRANLDVCDTWDERGARAHSLECGNALGHWPFPKELTVDPLTTKEWYEIHLKNGVILRHQGGSTTRSTQTASGPSPR